MPKDNKKCGCLSIIEEEWDLVVRDWDEKEFYSLRVPMFFHRPIGLSRRLAKAMSVVRHQEYEMIKPSLILLKDGLFVGRIMVGIKTLKEKHSKVLTMPSRKMISKVFHGDRKALNDAVSELLSYARSKQSKQPENIYFWYTTCQECDPTNEGKLVILGQL